MQETRVQSLGWEDPLETGKAIYSSILAWRIRWTISPWDHRIGHIVTFAFTITSHETECVFWTKKQKSRTIWLHKWILPNIYENVNSYLSQMIWKSCRGINTSEFIVWGQHHSDIKIRKDNTKNKSKGNITDEHLCKSPQQIIHKLCWAFTLHFQDSACVPLPFPAWLGPPLTGARQWVGKGSIG